MIDRKMFGGKRVYHRPRFIATDLASVTAAIAALTLRGGGVLTLPHMLALGSTEQISIAAGSGSGIEFQGHPSGTTVTKNAGATPALVIGPGSIPTTVTATLVEDNYQQGTDRISVVSATGLSVGNYYYLQSDYVTPYPDGSTNTLRVFIELVRIKKITGTSITLEKPLAQGWAGATMTLTAVSVSRNISFKNITISGNTSMDQAFFASHVDGLTFSGCTIGVANSSGIQIKGIRNLVMCRNAVSVKYDAAKADSGTASIARTRLAGPLLILQVQTASLWLCWQEGM